MAGVVPAVNKPGRKEDDGAHHLEVTCWGLLDFFFFIFLMLLCFLFIQAQVCLERNYQPSQ